MLRLLACFGKEIYPSERMQRWYGRLRHAASLGLLRRPAGSRICGLLKIEGTGGPRLLGKKVCKRAVRRIWWLYVHFYSIPPLLVVNSRVNYANNLIQDIKQSTSEKGEAYRIMQRSLESFKRRRLSPAPQCTLATGVSIPLAQLTMNQLHLLQAQLTFQPRSTYDRAVTPEPLITYRMEGSTIRVPRCTPLVAFSVDDQLTLGSPMAALSFTTESREHQVVAIEKTLAALRQAPYACILTLPCGYGKTFVALKVAHALGRKTLVCVHKECLLYQWRERIEQFLPGCRVGRIQGSRCDVQEKDVVVATVQTLSVKDIGEDVLCEFGMVILDEAHHMAARMFSEVFYRVSCRYVLGLTATPKRKDGCTAVLHLHMGSFSYSVEARSPEKVGVRLIPYPSKYPVARETTPAETQKLVTRLTQDSTRNRIIVNECIRACSEGRNVICLTDRVEHVKNLLSQFQTHPAACGVDAAAYVGGLSAKTRKRTEEVSQVIFGTYSMAKEGLDIARLDTLVLASPASDITQAVGRILRPNDDKKLPLVVDVCDDLTHNFTRQSTSRRALFERWKYDIEVVHPSVGGSSGREDVT